MQHETTPTDARLALPEFVSLESALDAIDHVSRHNGPGREVEARRMLVRQRPDLWCLHIQGPDDVHPAPSRAHAERAAEKFNAFMASRPDKRPLDPECRAVAAPWPHSAESHADDVEDFIERWLLPSWQIQALAKSNHPQAGEAVAWRHHTPHGWVVTKTMVSADSQPLYAAPQVAPVEQEAAPFGYLVHRRARLLGDRYFSAADFGKYWDEGRCDGSDRHHSDTFTALYTHPAADALGAVRELAAEWRKEALVSEGEVGIWAAGGNALKGCADELEAALAQAPISCHHSYHYGAGVEPYCVQCGAKEADEITEQAPAVRVTDGMVQAALREFRGMCFQTYPEQEMRAALEAARCLRCGSPHLDTGWECTDCGYDNLPHYAPPEKRKEPK